jgi:hypothetical protein
MLPDLLEVDERVLQPLADSGHATKRSPLQLLTLEQGLSVLEQAHVVTRDCLNQRFCCGQLTKGNSEVVRIVKSVQQITMERMDIREAREGLDCGGEALGEGFGGVLDFSGVERSNSANLEASANLYWLSVLDLLLHGMGMTNG